MLRRIIFATILFLATGIAVLGQNNTQVTATVVGSNTAPWANATAYAALVCPGNEQAYIGTFPIPMNSPTTKFDANGTFSQVLYNTAVLRTVNGATLTCQYQYHITDQCGQNSFISNSLTGITGSGPVNLSSQINATAPPPCVPGGQGPAAPPLNSTQYNKAGSFGGEAYLYNPSDTGPAFCATIPCASFSANTNLGLYSNSNGLEGLFTHVIGGDVTASNLTPGNCVQAGTGGILGTTSAPCPTSSSTGTVTNVSSGNLQDGLSNNVWTVSISNPTTTPAFTFSIGNESSNTFFAAPDGSFGQPSFRSIHVSDVPNSNGSCSSGSYMVGWTTNLVPSCTTLSTGLGVTKIQAVRITGGICTTGGGAEVKCTMSGIISWPSAFADTNYAIVCQPTTVTGSGTNPGMYQLVWANKTTSGADLVIQGGSASAAGNVTTSEIDCIGVHP